MDNRPGIYKIVCLDNNKIYIGSSQTVRQRIINHKSDLRSNKHQNTHLQRAWNKYQENGFKFELIQYCDIEVLLEREQFYIDLYNCYKTGFNRMPQAASPRGRKYTEEEKQKRALTRKSPWNKGLKNPCSKEVVEEAQRKRNIKRELRGGAWNKGVSKSEQRKLEQREESTTKKPVLIFDKQSRSIVGEFQSLSDLSRDIHIRRDMLSYLCLSFKKKNAFVDSIKYNIPYYIAYKEDYEVLIIKNTKHGR